MTLVLKLDLDIIKMYVCIENEVPTFSGSSYHLNRHTDRQMDRQTDRQADRQTRLKLLPTAYADGKYVVIFRLENHDEFVCLVKALVALRDSGDKDLFVPLPKEIRERRFKLFIYI